MHKTLHLQKTGPWGDVRGLAFQYDNIVDLEVGDWVDMYCLGEEDAGAVVGLIKEVSEDGFVVKVGLSYCWTVKKPLTKERFYELKATWNRDTCFLSCMKSDHWAFQEAINNANDEVIKWILEDSLNEEFGTHWFTLLYYITKENPVPKAHAGRIQVMRDHWTQWGIERGYING